MSESVGEPANDRQRSLELMRNVGDEIRPYGLQLPALGQVEDREDGAASREWPRRESEKAGVDSQLVRPRRCSPERIIQCLAKPAIPREMLHRKGNSVTDAKQLPSAAVDAHDLAACIHRHHPLLQ